MKKKFIATSIIIALCAISSSCLMIGVTFGGARTWLNSMKGKPGIDITGEWDAGSVFGGGWGGSKFVQNGNEINGIMGLYNVQGVVDGDNVYLVFTSSDRVYYTGHLKPMDKKTMAGLAVEKAIINSEEAKDAQKYPIIMKKYIAAEEKKDSKPSK
jgi:hypothetical protein